MRMASALALTVTVGSIALSAAARMAAVARVNASMGLATATKNMQVMTALRRLARKTAPTMAHVPREYAPATRVGRVMLATSSIVQRIVTITAFAIKVRAFAAKIIPVLHARFRLVRRQMKRFVVEMATVAMALVLAMKGTRAPIVHRPFARTTVPIMVSVPIFIAGAILAGKVMIAASNGALNCVQNMVTVTMANVSVMRSG